MLILDGLKITEHAMSRMAERRLDAAAINVALSFGREIHTRGITIFAVGRKEIRKADAMSINISRFDGLHVLCSRDGSIVTTYRNFSLRGLKPRARTRFDRFLTSRAA